MEGKIHLNTIVGPGIVKGFTLKPKEMTVEAIGLGMDSYGGSVCMIGNTVYSYCAGDQLKWTDARPNCVRNVEDLEGLPKFASYRNVTLGYYGGKLVVFWDKYLPASWFTKKTIWCAVISLEKRSSEEIWGNVEWLDAVLTVPRSYKFVYAIAATV